MKKKLLALAVLSVFAGMASAQTNVAVYGIVDASIAKETGSAAAMSSGNLSASRYGFRGTEDLGGGMNAHFLLEGGFNVDTGASGSTGKMFSRLSYVGLNGGFGTVRLGRQNAPLKVALDAIDPFKGGGDLAAVDTFGNGGTWPERVNNQITYITNNLSGFSGSASYVFGETGNSNKPNRQYGLQMGYAGGPVNVQFGYNNANESTTGPVTNNDAKITFLGATYDFGVAKAHAGVGETKFERNTPAAPRTRSRNYLLGLTVPFGANQVIGTITRNDERDTANADYTQYGVAFLHDLSKRTTLYAQYAHVNNDGRSSFRVDRAGASNNRVALGVRHSF